MSKGASNDGRSDGDVQGGLTLEQFAEVTAHLLHFRGMPPAAVLRRFGLDESSFRIAETGFRILIAEESMQFRSRSIKTFAKKATQIQKHLSQAKPELAAVGADFAPRDQQDSRGEGAGPKAPVPLVPENVLPIASPKTSSSGPVMSAPLAPPLVPMTARDATDGIRVPRDPAAREDDQEDTRSTAVAVPASGPLMPFVPANAMPLDDLDTTAPPLDSPFAFPFKKGDGSMPRLEPDEPDGDDQSGSTAVAENPIAATALPWERAEPAATVGPGRKLPALDKTPIHFGRMEQGRTSPPNLSLEQYASLCAELAVFQERRDEIRSRYGLSAATHQILDQTWRRQLDGDAAAKARWQQLFQRFRGWLSTRG